MVKKIFENINRYLFNISAFIICFIYLSYFIQSFYIDYIGHYAFKELFVNYEGGFVRRGLIGQIFLYFYNIFEFKPEVFFPILMIFFHSIYLFLFLIILKKYQNYHLLK